MVAVGGRQVGEQVRLGGEDFGMPAGGPSVLLPVREDHPDQAEEPLVTRRAEDVRGVSRVLVVETAEVLGCLAQGYPPGNHLMRSVYRLSELCTAGATSLQ